ncbi:MAG: ArsR family transcriptional regulator [Gemmatimonadota bacterium]|nr:ArsR family transcriptional regulator [Gemmatimonadota bacterium]
MEELLELGDPCTVALKDVAGCFQFWLHLPDVMPLYAVLGAIAANLLPGDPVWLGIVAPPSSAKTEILNAMSRLPNMHPAATLTPASLLSGTAKKDRAVGAKGGLLRQIGDFGILILKDFGSVLSMRPDAKSEVLAALREVYDGSWTRHLGTDGGQTLTWSGNVGLIFGVTPILDTHHSVIAAMGERFLLCRQAPAGEEQARRALGHAGSDTAKMRCELAEAVRQLFDRQLKTPRPLSENERERLIELASLAVRIRSTVERERNSREIESIHGAEGPARLVLALERLVAGLDSLGCERRLAFDVVGRVAMDSVPPLRWRALQWLKDQKRRTATSGGRGRSRDCLRIPPAASWKI